MRTSTLRLDALGRHADWAPTVLRAFAATFLIYMSQDNVVSGERMREFERFLAQFGFPLVPLAARVSVFAQFGAGILFALGLLVRPAAAVMAFNFVVALVMVHRHLPFREALDPAAMLATALALLLTGGGALSLDGWLAARERARLAPPDARGATSERQRWGALRAP